MQLRLVVQLQLLPFDGEPVSLGEAETPIIALPKTGGSNLLVKDEGRLPTGSFKARGLAMAVSMAKALGLSRLAVPTQGNAGDSLAENLNPVGRMYYAASTMICTPASLAQEVGLGLGAQAGEHRLGEVAKQAGFGRFRRAAETPFNLIFEVRR